MRPSRNKIIVIFITALAIWSAYYIFFGEPLDQTETLLVVGATAVFVVLASAGLTRPRRRGGTDAGA